LDVCWNKFDPNGPIGSANNFKIISEYLKAFLEAAIEDRVIIHKDGRFVCRLDGQKINNLDSSGKYPPTKFSTKDLLDDPSIRFLLKPRTFAIFTLKESIDRDMLNKNPKSDPMFYKGYEILNPYIPSSASTEYSIIQHSSRILEQLSFDAFHFHLPSVRYINEINLMEHLQDVGHYLALPLGMLQQVKRVVNENIYRTVTNFMNMEGYLGKNPQKRFTESELQQKEMNVREKVFRKLVSLRIHSRTEVDDKTRWGIFKIMLIVLFIVIICACFAISNAMNDRSRIVEDPTRPSMSLTELWHELTPYESLQKSAGSIHKFLTVNHIVTIISSISFLILVLYNWYKSPSNYALRQFNRKSIWQHFLSTIPITFLTLLSLFLSSDYSPFEY